MARFGTEGDHHDRDTRDQRRPPLRGPAGRPLGGRPLPHRSRPRTSTTSPSRGCSTPPSPAATSPAAASSSIDVSAARELPGVVAVYTAADLNHLVLDHRVDRSSTTPATGRSASSPTATSASSASRSPWSSPQSRYVAEDALELVVIDIDAEDAGGRLPPRPRARRARRARGRDVERAGAPRRRPRRHRRRPRRRARHADRDVPPAPLRVRADGDPRHASPAGTRSCEQLTVYASTQGPHGVRGQYRAGCSGSTTARCT